MKIKWRIEEREVPGIGVLNTGDIRIVPDDVGEQLVKQGHASIVTNKKKKKSKEV